MLEEDLIPKDLTYTNAKNLKDLETIEQLEVLEDLDDDIEYLKQKLFDLQKLYQKEQKIQIYNDIQDDDMYKELNTEKTISEDDLSQSFDNSSIVIGAPGETKRNTFERKNKSMLHSHTIRNKSRSDLLKTPTRSMIFDEDQPQVTFKRKNSLFDPDTRSSERVVRSRTIDRKVVSSVRNFLDRGFKQNVLMNSGISPNVKPLIQAGIIWDFGEGGLGRGAQKVHCAGETNRKGKTCAAQNQKAATESHIPRAKGGIRPGFRGLEL